MSNLQETNPWATGQSIWPVVRDDTNGEEPVYVMGVYADRDSAVMAMLLELAEIRIEEADHNGEWRDADHFAEFMFLHDAFEVSEDGKTVAVDGGRYGTWEATETELLKAP